MLGFLISFRSYLAIRLTGWPQSVAKVVRGSPKHLLKYFIRLPKVLSCGRGTGGGGF